jgi:hypothetical protein
MSSEVTTAFVKQFSSNVFHLSQQKGSRLSGAVRNESQVGKSGFYDRIGSTAAVKKTSRHSDTPQIDTPHSRRRVTLVDYEWADLIDEVDKVRMLMSPESEYAQAAAWALGRSKDDEIIDAASGSAYGGEEGSTAVTLPNSQKIVAFDGTTTAGVNLNVATLRLTKKILDENDVDESIPRYLACTASQIQSLLSETEVTSSDYNSVRALVMGEINTFMGFQFIRTEQLDRPSANITFSEVNGSVGAGCGTLVATTSRSCIAWAMDGLLLATAKNVKGRISERGDKSYSTQVYACMSIGATRMEEEKVVEINCAE